MSAQSEAPSIANALYREWHNDALNYDTALTAADELRRLHAENEANERNLYQLTDELAKTVVLLRQAWAVIRWQCFGECRTDGVDDLPTPSEVDIAIREHLNKSKK